jgi:hypothetical protein
MGKNQDPGSGINIPDPQHCGMGKKSGSESGMINPDHISESLENIFWGLNTSGKKKIPIRDPG